MSLLTTGLVIVTGKGGTGKSTVAAALGMAAAARGRRTVIVELGAQQRIPRMLDAPPGRPGEPQPIGPNLEALSFDPALALERELLAQLPVRLLAQRLVENRAVSTAAQAAPGLRELLALSVIRDLLRGHHDSVVLDAPASGHAAGLLDVPRTVAGVARVGPVRKRADGLTAMLEDPHRTRVVLVSTPDDLPVAETLETWERLASGRVAVAGTIANAVAQPAFEAADQAVLERIGPDAGPLARAALDAACSSIAAHAAQRERLDRLPRVLAELPLLHDGAAGRDAITELAAHLEHV